MKLSFSQRLGLRVGIEELTEGATGDEDLGETGGTVVLPDEPTETVEGALDESQTAEAEVVDVAAEADQMERTVETMEKIAAGLTVALRNGGCTPGEAYAYQVGLESAFGPFGMGLSASASLENIGSAKNPRLEATRITLEGLNDNLKKWWDGLMAIWDKVYVAVKGWLMKIFDSIPAIKKRAEEIIKKSGELKSAVQQKEKINFAAAKIAAGNTAPASADVLTNVTKAVDLVGKSLTTGPGANQAANASMLELLNALVKDTGNEGAEKKAIEAVLGDADTYGEGLAVGNKDKYGGDGLTAKITKPYIGNKIIVVTMPESLEKDGKSIGIDAAVRGFTWKLADADVKLDANEVPAPTAEHITNIAKNVIVMCDTLSKYRNGWNDREKAKSGLSKSIKTDIDAIAKTDKAEQAANAKKIGTAIQSYSAKTANFEAQLASYGARFAQVALDYCNKGLANYGTDAPKKEEPKKEGETK